MIIRCQTFNRQEHKDMKKIVIHHWFFLEKMNFHSTLCIHCVPVLTEDTDW